MVCFYSFQCMLITGMILNSMVLQPVCKNLDNTNGSHNEGDKSSSGFHLLATTIMVSFLLLAVIFTSHIIAIAATMPFVIYSVVLTLNDLNL